VELIRQRVLPGGMLTHERRGKRMKKLIAFLKDEEGATAVEYGIMVAAIAAVIIAVVMVVGKKTNNAFQNVNANM